MKIGELAKRSGLTNSRIRFYESIGLLEMVDRGANGYRSYPREAVAVLDLITTAQKAGFSLDEIRALMPGDFGNWQHGALLEALRRKVIDIEALEARLKTSKAHLNTVIRAIEAKPDDVDCAANARRLMAQLLDGSTKGPALATGDVKLLGKGADKRKAN